MFATVNCTHSDCDLYRHISPAMKAASFAMSIIWEDPVSWAVLSISARNSRAFSCCSRRMSASLGPCRPTEQSPLLLHDGRTGPGGDEGGSHGRAPHGLECGGSHGRAP